MVGEVTSTTAFVQVRLTSDSPDANGNPTGIPGFVEFTIDTIDDAQAPIITQQIAATAQHDFIARATFDTLKPGLLYRCTTRIGQTSNALVVGPTAIFKTLPGANQQASNSFAVVTGMNYARFHGTDTQNARAPYAGPDKALGYPSLATIESLLPDFFIGTGDNVYYDTPYEGRAETREAMRQKWHEQFAQPRYHQLFAFVPTYWMIDDHDYRIDDADNTGDYAPSPALARQLVFEQLPVVSQGDSTAKNYRTHRINKDLQIWLPENRMYRSPNATPDGPDKSIWGAEQKAWLKQTLLESDATFKLLVSPTPMIGPDDLRKTDNHTNHGGFRHERDAFFAWLQATGLDKNHFYIITGDRHWQYHSVHPTGIEEFSSGALVDANARLGRKPGDPKSTDPEGLIRQPYTQTEASGGFLMVSVSPAPATLTFTWYDEKGAVLHSVSKESKVQPN